MLAVWKCPALAGSEVGRSVDPSSLVTRSGVGAVRDEDQAHSDFVVASASVDRADGLIGDLVAAIGEGAA